MDDFIRVYNDVLDERIFNALTQLIDNQQYAQWSHRSDKHRKDRQYALEPFWPELAEEINSYLIGKCLGRYFDDFPYLKDQEADWMSGTTILQKTEPCEGYHSFHAENVAWSNRFRALAWMIYLNDVEEGGETEFLYQKKRFKPTKNTALIWPGSWTHLHRGNPPISGSKYILTGWFAPMNGMGKFSPTQQNVQTELKS